MEFALKRDVINECHYCGYQCYLRRDLAWHIILQHPKEDMTFSERCKLCRERQQKRPFRAVHSRLAYGFIK
ncbi:hypothetical protein Ciccas_008582 [Cichlidogyrus casuarinus]|uniref:C2H2-type domain-containing protein n=1 Tax=Cichlidogyrus casuarinus TaxID=1844966 RepID=A0ABD2Q0D6_9PLAT